MSDKYTYLLLDLITIIGPFALSFDKKVAFYKSYRSLLLSVGIASVLYLVWDVWFTAEGIWKFNNTYLLGKYIINLPIEEFLFFLVVPYACLFIYRCLQSYFPKQENQKWGIWANTALMLFSAGMFMANFGKLYTTVTFGLITATLISLLSLGRLKFMKYSAHLFSAWIIAILPMMYINGKLTGLPVLIYNDVENLGIRIGTIPLEDFFYNYLYMLWMVIAFEYFNSKPQDLSNSTP